MWLLCVRVGIARPRHRPPSVIVIGGNVSKSGSECSVKCLRSQSPLTTMWLLCVRVGIARPQHRPPGPTRCVLRRALRPTPRVASYAPRCVLRRALRPSSLHRACIEPASSLHRASIELGIKTGIESGIKASRLKTSSVSIEPSSHIDRAVDPRARIG